MEQKGREGKRPCGCFTIQLLCGNVRIAMHRSFFFSVFFLFCSTYMYISEQIHHSTAQKKYSINSFPFWNNYGSFYYLSFFFVSLGKSYIYRQREARSPPEMALNTTKLRNKQCRVGNTDERVHKILFRRWDKAGAWEVRCRCNGYGTWCVFRAVCLAVVKGYTDSGALGKGLLFTGETLHIYLLMFRSVSFIYNE